jgi:hypothetical protein
MRGIIKLASQDIDNSELLTKLSAIKQTEFHQIMSLDGCEDLNSLKREVRNNYYEHHHHHYLGKVTKNNGATSAAEDASIVLPLDLSLTLQGVYRR